MSKQRNFEGTRKGKPFTVTTTLTDAEAITLLRESGSDFERDCADQIEILSMSGDKTLPEAVRKKLRPRSNLVAWGFRLAVPALTLHPSFRERVRFRKPLTLGIKGEAVTLSLCGDRSKYAGKIRVTNGLSYGDPEQRFYGYVEPDGTWRPPSITPSLVVEALTSPE